MALNDSNAADSGHIELRLESEALACDVGRNRLVISSRPGVLESVIFAAALLWGTKGLDLPRGPPQDPRNYERWLRVLLTRSEQESYRRTFEYWRVMNSYSGHTEPAPRVVHGMGSLPEYCSDLRGFITNSDSLLCLRSGPRLVLIEGSVVRK